MHSKVLKLRLYFLTFFRVVDGLISLGHIPPFLSPFGDLLQTQTFIWLNRTLESKNNFYFCVVPEYTICFNHTKHMTSS